MRLIHVTKPGAKVSIRADGSAVVASPDEPPYVIQPDGSKQDLSVEPQRDLVCEFFDFLRGY
jgi:hypothetical protein